MEESITPQTGSAGKTKFIVGGALIVAAGINLIVSSTQAGAQYFFTIDELNSKGGEVIGRDLRISGAVIGDSLEYDPETLTLRFMVAHVPGDNKEIDSYCVGVKVLYDAVNEPNRNQLQVVYNGVKPDLLRHEAQAIMTGQLAEDGVFHADELLYKCPTKYEEAVPEQTG